MLFPRKLLEKKFSLHYFLFQVSLQKCYFSSGVSKCAPSYFLSQSNSRKDKGGEHPIEKFATSNRNTNLICVFHLLNKLKVAKLTTACHNNNSLPNLHVLLLIITQQDYTSASSMSIRIVWSKVAPLSFTREEETSPF